MEKNTKLLIIIISLCHHAAAEVVQAQSDDACELRIDNGIHLMSINQMWTNVADPCMTYKCNQVNGSAVVEQLMKECNYACGDDFIFKAPLPGECCGNCVENFCIENGTKYKLGDVWKSSDKCMINECVIDGENPAVSSYQKKCPKLRNCPKESIELRDCCPYCNYRNAKLSNLPSEIQFTNRDTYRSHPCLRECVDNQPLTCYYEFVVENYETMSKACYNCPQNESDCSRPHCVSADGMRRSIIVVNRMMPGPAIEVCYNDTIIVDVKNHLISEGTTIHWHGIHQRKSPFMDGVPHVSQCPIQPGQTFRYTFKAENAGTHLWHSHLGMQRGDGAFGALIVRKSKEVHEDLYDYDMSDHIMISNDWTHMPGVAVFTSHHHGNGDNKPPNILINGKGKYFGNMTVQKIEINAQVRVESEEVTTAETTTLEMETTDYSYLVTDVKRVKRAILPPSENSPLIPFETFNVVKGYRYRFRHINAGFLNCPIQISIDNHTMIAISSDGNDIEAQEVTFLVTYAGERWDFVVKADQEPGNYFIRARGLMDCDQRFTSSFQMAVLHYQGTEEIDPTGITPSYELDRSGLSLNTLNTGHGVKDSLNMAEVKSISDEPNRISKIEPDFKFYLGYDFYAKDHSLFHKPNLYEFNKVPFGKIYSPQLNHISMRMPSIPAMVAKEQLDSTFCNETSLAAQGINCKETFCECTHVLQVPLNSVVEMILIDEGVTYDANHMFHLHGGFFHVVGMDRLGSNITVEEVKELDKSGRLRRKFLNSVRKDTVTVPDGGYTIIRFFADNPGVWLMHCHIDFHAEVGMAIMLKIGNYDQMPVPPKGFPTCADFTIVNETIASGSTQNNFNIPLITLFIVFFYSL